VRELKIMATGRRISRVAELIKREVSQMLLHDIKDERVGSGMISVTDVDVSGDLQHAKIFVSIYGTEEAKVATMKGLQSATGYVRSQLGKRVNLRRTPEVIFVEDNCLSSINFPVNGPLKKTILKAPLKSLMLRNLRSRYFIAGAIFNAPLQSV
jgi:ribosome-binding factor A